MLASLSLALALALAVIAYLLFSPRPPFVVVSGAVDYDADGDVHVTLRGLERQPLRLILTPDEAYRTGTTLCRGAAFARRAQGGDAVPAIAPPVTNGSGVA
jgi:hypothetical protein